MIVPRLCVLAGVFVGLSCWTRADDNAPATGQGQQRPQRQASKSPDPPGMKPGSTPRTSGSSSTEKFASGRDSLKCSLV
jgi:hypothetical protein